MTRNFTIHHGHVLDVLRGMESESVHCVVTSPPYWGLRDYGCEGQIGLEPTPQAYLDVMVELMREVRRVLRSDGTLWLNLGDSYAGSWGNYGGQNRGNGTQREITSGSSAPSIAYDGLEQWRPPTTNPPGLKPKDLCMIPARVALALQADGWWLRSDIVWAKPAPMPESVTDRPTRSHEQIYLLTKADRYFYDQNAVRQPLKQSSIDRLSQDVENQNGSTRANGGAKSNGNIKAAVFGGRIKSQINDQTRLASGNEWRQDVEQGANLRDVWTINTEGFRDAHFAVFPTEIPRRCILAGTSEKGVCAECGAAWMRVLKKESYDKEGWGAATKDHHGAIMGSQSMIRDGNGRAGSVAVTTLDWQPSCKHEGDPIPATVVDPFCGSGTTGLVALRHGRNFVGIELNPEYVEMATRRIEQDAPLFNVLASAVSGHNDRKQEGFFSA